MTDRELYNVGDYVTVENQSTLRLEIGRIEDIMKQQNVFTYIVYCKPEETDCGRQNYRGKNEILKTSVNQEESIIFITSKPEVLKLTDYVKLSKDEKASQNRFVCRQNYDSVEYKLAPELKPECFCNQIINPDNDLLICDCEKIYHYGCVSNENSTCSCGNSILSTAETFYKKRKLDEDKSILLKNHKDEEFYQLFANALDEAATGETGANSHIQNRTENANNINNKRPFPVLEIKKHSRVEPFVEDDAEAEHPAYGEYDPLSFGDENDFNDFKLHKKPLQLPKLDGYEKPLEDYANYLLPSEYEIESKKSPLKRYDDPLQIKNLSDNKLIDKEVLKSAVNVFFDKTYNNMSERLHNHLKMDVATSILDEINKKHKTDSSE